ncbi:MAG: hypothetical protein MI892_11015 [Desulfobacterales bacterium]|nr:hypothetical protein [Desulfobacterales bacterium]
MNDVKFIKSNRYNGYAARSAIDRVFCRPIYRIFAGSTSGFGLMGRDSTVRWMGRTERRRDRGAAGAEARTGDDSNQ